MRRRYSVLTAAAGSLLWAATASFAAPAEGPGDGGSYAAPVGTGVAYPGPAYPSAAYAAGFGYPVVPAPSPYAGVWDGYQGERPGGHPCQCGHCGSTKKFSMRKAFASFRSSIDRVLLKRSSCGCDCGCNQVAYTAEPGCGCEGESGCDAMGPSTIDPPAPPSETQGYPTMRPVHPNHLMPRMHPGPPTAPTDPEDERYPSLRDDPFEDDDSPTSARLPNNDGAYYLR